jgi:prolipoprotein diacylglyceryltransferase
VIGWYLVLYSSVRFAVEFFRVHEQSLVGPFSLTQWISLALLALGVGILLYVSRKTMPSFESAALSEPRA